LILIDFYSECNIKRGLRAKSLDFRLILNGNLWSTDDSKQLNDNISMNLPVNFFIDDKPSTQSCNFLLKGHSFRSSSIPGAFVSSPPPDSISYQQTNPTSRLWNQKTWKITVKSRSQCSFIFPREHADMI